MNKKDEILSRLTKGGGVSGKVLQESLGISRQAVNVHMKELIRQGWVVKEGVTRGAMYRISSRKEKAQAVRFRRKYTLKGLQEDRVYDEVVLFTGLRRQVSNCAADILHYAFTEILNNAIDHSKSKQCKVEFGVDAYECWFRIRDFGIGIFQSISSKYGLPDESMAAGELLKGKVSTAPERHTGEGIFFSSKAADIMSFRSHAVQMLFDNRKKDVFVEEKRFLDGTDVEFRLGRKTRRRLDGIFSEYAPERHDYQFDKTRVLVRLFQKDYVSRSEARRLMAGLDRFKEIELDFEGVTKIGQGFADEIFRVFAGAHPQIELKPIHIKPALEAMVRHVVDNKTSMPLTIS